MSVRNTALSLVEVLVSNFLLVLILFSLFAVLSGMLSSIRRADFLLGAETCAQEGLAEQTSQQLDDLTLGKSPARTLGAYTREIEILKVAGIEPELLKEIRVVVRWQERGQTRQFARSVLYGGVSD